MISYVQKKKKKKSAAKSFGKNDMLENSALVLAQMWGGERWVSQRGSNSSKSWCVWWLFFCFFFFPRILQAPIWNLLTLIWRWSATKLLFLFSEIIGPCFLALCLCYQDVHVFAFINILPDFTTAAFYNSLQKFVPVAMRCEHKR